MTNKQAHSSLHAFQWIKPSSPPLEACNFYHSLSLPSGEVTGQWDLRPETAAYLGNISFAERSVLEIGPASGFLSFYMEKAGASVTCVEPPMSYLWDAVPHGEQDVQGWREDFAVGIERLRNSFWYCHRLHHSRVRVLEANPYHLPEEMGTFDIGLLASVLLHVRDPFSMIESVARRVTQTMVITEVYYPELGAEPVCRFMPQAAVRQFDTWWQFSPQYFASTLELLGFSEIRLSFHRQRCVTLGEDVPMFTLVAERKSASNAASASEIDSLPLSVACLLARQGDWQTLAQELLRFENTSPENWPQGALLFLSLLAQGKPPSEDKEFTELAAITAASSPALLDELHGADMVAYRLLEIVESLSKENRQQIEALLQAAVAIAPECPPAWLHLAWFQYENDALQNAIAAAVQAKQALRSDDAPAQGIEIDTALAWFLIEDDQPEAAEALLVSALAATQAPAPEHAPLYNHLGMLLFRKGKLTEAAQALSAALQLDPTLDEAAATLGWILHDQGKLLEASIWARRALAQRRTPDRLAQLGWLLLRQERAAEAIELLQEALLHAPEQLSTRLHLAQALCAEERLNEAQALYLDSLTHFPDAPDLLLAAAWLHHRLNDPARARALTEEALALNAESASAWHLLGTLTLGEAQPEQAKRYLAQALALDESIANAALLLTPLLREEKQFEEAAHIINAALKHHREDLDLLRMELLLLLDLDKGEAARRLAHRLLRRDPKCGLFWLRLAQALLKTGRRTIAVLALRRAQRSDPKIPEAWSLDAWLALEEHQHHRARNALTQLLTLIPDSPGTHIQAAFILAACGDLVPAAAHAETAVAKDGESTESWRALGHIRHRQGRLVEAETALRHALSLQPLPATHCLRQLGWILRSTGRFGEAHEAFALAAQEAADDPVCQYELADAAALCGEPQAAFAALEKALALRPQWARALLLRARLLRQRAPADWPEAISLCAGLLRRREELSEAAALLMEMAALGDEPALKTLKLLSRQERLHFYRDLLNRLQATGCNRVFLGLAKLARQDFPENMAVAASALQAQAVGDAITPAELARQMRIWQRRLSMQAGLTPFGAPPNFPQNEKIRIAYVAAHFHRSLLIPVLAAHRINEVEIYLYCDIPVESLGDLSGRIRLQALRGQDLAASIRANRIDVAIDTVGIESHSGQDEVLRHFARRLAPVQCGWLGNWAGSGGLFDYLLADEWSIPATSEALYEEGVLRLPGGQWCWEAPAFSPPLISPPCLSSRAITLGCAVRAFRLSTRTLACWARLLQRLPEARLLLLGEHGQIGQFRRELNAALEAAGVDPDRVTFKAQQAYPDYLAAYTGVDIVLDGFPSNGGLCLLDALWMGVPVVSLTGTWMGERQGASLLQALGHPEWVAADEEHYINIVCSLAEKPEALAELRLQLRRKMQNSMLLDGQRMASAIEEHCHRLVMLARDVAHAESPKERYRAVAQRQLDTWFDKPAALDLGAHCSSYDRNSPLPPDVSVILVLYKQAGLARQTIAALADQRGCCFETIVVDNASGGDTNRLLDRLQGARIVRNAENVGFLRAANQGAALSKGRYLLFLNSDALLHEGALLQAMHRLETESDIGAVGGRIVLADGTLQEAGCIAYRTGATAGYGRGRDPQASEFSFVRDVDFCSGAFLMVRRDPWFALDGFDRAFAPAYYEDTDFCLRLQDAGFRVVYDPDIRLSHFEWGSATTGRDAIELMERNRDLFARRHSTRLSKRPHPLLTPAANERWLARRKTRILVIDNAVPHMAIGGGLPRARLVLHALAEHDMTLFPLWTIDEDWRDVRASLPETIEVILGVGAAGLKNFLTERQGVYDFLMVSRPPNMAFVNSLWEESPELFAGMRLVYDTEAIFALREIGQARVNGKALPRQAARKMLRDELALCRRADAVLTVSERETRLFRAAGAQGVHLLSHAMATRQDAPDWASRKNLLFVGALHPDTPNEDGLLWFCREVLPRINAGRAEPLQLEIVGDCRSERIAALTGQFAPLVRLLGRVDDLTPCYDRARIFVAPTRFAAGVPAKVIEAACNGIPVVASQLLVRQLGWQADQEILSAGDAADFARAVLSLYENEALWFSVHTAMRAKTQRSYAPEEFSRTLQQVFSPASASEESTAQSAKTSDKPTCTIGYS